MTQTFKEKLEALGSTPSRIIGNLLAEGYTFDRVHGEKSCIMIQFFTRNGVTRRDVFCTLGEIDPNNKREIEQVININDILVDAGIVAPKVEEPVVTV